MEIKNSGKPGIAGGHAAGTPAPQKPSAQKSHHAEAKAPAPGDRVTLTPAAQRLVSSDAIESEPPVDRARVETLREALADGRYRVDAQRVAERLIRVERER
jgi:negative regulator of flagellin synthesis FlgM